MMHLLPLRRNHSLRRWDDISSLSDLQKDFSRFAKGLQRTLHWGDDLNHNEDYLNFIPAVDIKDQEHTLVVNVDLPGLSEKDLEVTLSDNTLRIKGERHSEKEEKKKHYYRMERSYGHFERVLDLPCEVETNKAEARFKDGVLTVTIHKSPQARATEKPIQIKTT